jgi:two-component system response regulator FixJ
MSNSIVHLIDDDADVRRALAFLLGTAGLTVRIYESASEFLGQELTSLSGCVVTDVRMPGIDGLELLKRLTAGGIRLPVVVMTGHADVPLAVEAMKAGAVDFIEKPFADEILLAAIQMAVARGSKMGQADEEGAQVRARLATLSPRERDVLNGLLAGHPNKTIAYDLGLSPRTVEVHRANVMAKMAAASLSDLVRMTLQCGNA